MIPYSAGRGHCPNTGLWLFVIQAEVEAKPARTEHWRKKDLGDLRRPRRRRRLALILMQAESDEADEAAGIKRPAPPRQDPGDQS
jgi:hypothetical protein